jgi:DNA helicase II / ATP-dependent DNA helicase PcrA
MLNGQMRYGVVSRFIDELPETLCKWLTPRGGGYNAGFTPRSDLWSDVREPASPYSPRRSPVVREAAPAYGGYAFNIGQNVRHAKFGEGVVLGCEGRGADARVQVKFRDEGVKWLALEYAKLQTV